MIFTTLLTAIDNNDGQLKLFDGPRINAISWKDADAKIADRPYLAVDGILIAEVDEETGEINDFIYWN